MRWLDRRRCRKLLSELEACRHSEDDLLSPECRREFDAVILDLKAGTAVDAKSAYAEAKRRFAGLKLPTRYGAMRNWLDLFLVIGAVAFGLRGLFFQPFSIPTGSMQPTLYGIHYRTREGELKWPLPEVLKSVLFSVRRAEAKVRTAGMVAPESLHSEGGLLESTGFTLGEKNYTLPGSPAKVLEYTGLEAERHYPAGSVLADGYLSLGDHLFVERLSLYLVPPRRGDVLVFNTEGLFCNGEPLVNRSGYYYVKRLAALPGDTVKLTGHQLWVRPAGRQDFVPVQELDKRFVKVYGGTGGYQGHLADMGVLGENQEYQVPADAYFMLGDNSAFSLDSRFFGPVPRRNLVGRAFWVFWPFTRRFGLVDRPEPLPEPTGTAEHGSFRVMYRQ